MSRSFTQFSFSVAEKTGICAYLLAFIVFWIDLRLVVIPLVTFVVLCAAAPFCPSIPFFLPVVAKGSSVLRAVAITFDDGPDPLTTFPLLQLLEKYRLHATFFVNGANVDKYPDLVEKILSHGHDIGNHTYTHDNFIMLKNRWALKREIEQTGHSLAKFGVISHAFRPPVGVTNPRLQGVLAETKMFAVTFSFRPKDAGNRFIKGLADRILKRVRSGHIILLHEKMPGGPAKLGIWCSELERLFQGLQKQKFAILPLSLLIGRTVMTEEKKNQSCRLNFG
jgi:peptidoglycan/xylan/chitin deacetylase (PgdA/CDA1 family)